jgi:YegS/Rv2252/BmrU family lipid kinase
VRGLLIVNPRATTTSPRIIDVIVQALSHEIELDVRVTTHRGHATTLGEFAVAERLDLVITLGGDGVVHEVVNGMLKVGRGDDLPALATIPGGSANVFARSLGLSVDPVDATGQVLEAIREGRSRYIGVGCVETHETRYFIANAGVGLDAAIIEAMDRQRAKGKVASPARYLATTISEFFSKSTRKAPGLTLERPGGERVDHAMVALVQNTSPWTYFGAWPLDPCPQASFDTGLDVFAVQALNPITTMRAALRIVWRIRAGSAGNAITVWHDQHAFTVRADSPAPLQVDGEFVGNITQATFTDLPRALRVIV